MAKGLDGKFLHYGIRKEDLDLIRTLCEKHEIDFDWMSEEILRKYHAAKVDKIEMTRILRRLSPRRFLRSSNESRMKNEE